MVHFLHPQLCHLIQWKTLNITSSFSLSICNTVIHVGMKYTINVVPVYLLVSCWFEPCMWRSWDERESFVLSIRIILGPSTGTRLHVRASKTHLANLWQSKGRRENVFLWYFAISWFPIWFNNPPKHLYLLPVDCWSFNIRLWSVLGFRSTV